MKWPEPGPGHLPSMEQCIAAYWVNMKQHKKMKIIIEFDASEKGGATLLPSDIFRELKKDDRKKHIRVRYNDPSLGREVELTMTAARMQIDRQEFDF